jgi:three-Cys-motif partner protein
MSAKPVGPLELGAEDDGLYIPEVGGWSEDKYQLLFRYADLFATSMKNKWVRCYIDLFSGSGFSRVRDTGRVIISSPLLALQVKDTFDRYIFCDANPRCISSLEERAARLKPTADCIFLNCDVNESVERILSNMPPYGKARKVLSFCFVDPYGMADIKFDTIRGLAGRFIDFLINVPTMDPTRNETVYLSTESAVVSDYLGFPSWRDIRRDGDPRIPFEFFVATLLDRQMKSIGYEYGGISEDVMIRSTDRNLALYSLAFYSRRDLGGKFWGLAKKYSDPQLKLF